MHLDINKSNLTNKVYEYNNKDEMQKELLRFLTYYILYRGQVSLRKEFNVNTPFDVIAKWFEIKPDMFLQNLDEFKKEIIFKYR